MLLVKTVCSTDWKGRPDHRVYFIARSDSKDLLIKAMNEDVVEWMICDIVDLEIELANEDEDEVVCDEMAEMLEEPGTHFRHRLRDYRSSRVAELSKLSPKEIAKIWKNDERWEMELDDRSHREFVEGAEGEWQTTVYHLLNYSDLEFVSSRI